MSDDATLADALSKRTTVGSLVEPGPDGYLKCTACAHRCVMSEGRAGACGVRFVRDGELRVPHGYVARRYVRAVETNTIFHVHPGARSLTFGMYGCDLRCAYCHNWRLSQALRDDGVVGEGPIEITPDALVDEAVAQGCDVLCAAYNEPMITAEWARAVFERAKARGLTTAVISDGHSTPEALAYMRPVTDAFRVDLKGYEPEHYKALGGRLEPVLASIAEAKRLGYWVEVVTLVVPGFNDDPRGLRTVAQKLADISPDLPWHLNAFHPRYKLVKHPRMPAEGLLAAAGAAYARGLRYVYVSNVPESIRGFSHTRCPACHETVVERADYATTSRAGLCDGACAACGEKLAGLWGDDRAIASVPRCASDAIDEMP